MRAVFGGDAETAAFTGSGRRTTQLRHRAGRPLPGRLRRGFESLQVSGGHQRHQRLPVAGHHDALTAVDDAVDRRALPAGERNDVIAQLVHLEYAAPDQDISLYINSPGGPVDMMTAVYDAMQVISCDVATTCVGRAASTAALLLAAGAPGKRAALPGARVLLQQPALAEPLRGQPSDLDVHARELLRQRGQLVDMLARHTGRDRDRVEADFERDLVLDATGARTHGLVDHVVRTRVG